MKWGQLRKLLPWHRGLAWLWLRGSGAPGACLVVSSKTEMAAITTQQGRNFDVSCRCCCCCCSFLAYISSTLMIRKQFDEQGGQQKGRARSQMAKPSQVENVPGCLARINIVISMKITISSVWTRPCTVLVSAVLQCRLLLATCHLALKHFAIYI